MSRMDGILRQPVSHAWETPPEFFRALDDEFHFVCDAAASTENALCHEFYTEQMDGLRCEWRQFDGAVWCNPPYGKTIGRWVEKAALEGRYVPVVLLIPSRTETSYWHEHVMSASEIRFVRGRLNFGGGREKGHNAPFPSAVVVFRPGWSGPPAVSAIGRDGRKLIAQNT